MGKHGHTAVPWPCTLNRRAAGGRWPAPGNPLPLAAGADPSTMGMAFWAGGLGGALLLKGGVRGGGGPSIFTAPLTSPFDGRTCIANPSTTVNSIVPSPAVHTCALQAPPAAPHSPTPCPRLFCPLPKRFNGVGTSGPCLPSPRWAGRAWAQGALQLPAESPPPPAISQPASWPSQVGRAGHDRRGAVNATTIGRRRQRPAARSNAAGGPCAGLLAAGSVAMAAPFLTSLKTSCTLHAPCGKSACCWPALLPPPPLPPPLLPNRTGRSTRRGTAAPPRAVGGPVIGAIIIFFAIWMVWKRVDLHSWRGHPIPQPVARKAGGCCMRADLLPAGSAGAKFAAHAARCYFLLQHSAAAAAAASL